MRLSEAILLGDTMKRCDSATWLSHDGKCGCALGGALLACGITPEQFRQEYEAEYTGGGISAFSEMPMIKRMWPWLTYMHIMDISSLYYAVETGDKTIEDIIAYVRLFEPPEEDEKIVEKSLDMEATVSAY